MQHEPGAYTRRCECVLCVCGGGWGPQPTWHFWRRLLYYDINNLLVNINSVITKSYLLVLQMYSSPLANENTVPGHSFLCFNENLSMLLLPGPPYADWPIQGCQILTSFDGLFYLELTATAPLTAPFTAPLKELIIKLFFYLIYISLNWRSISFPILFWVTLNDLL